MPAGGNFDNKRTGKGSTLYLPVEVSGALLMAGDGHAAMGDAELSGTGIETSLDSKVRCESRHSERMQTSPEC